MELDDIEAVLAIEITSFHTPWKRDHFVHEIAAPHSFAYIAEFEGAVIGYVCLTSLFEVAQILDIAVATQQRGNGVALALMEFVIGLAREKGAEVMELEVRETNSAAISLYERLGFKVVGVRAKYYESTEDAIHMEKNLKEIP